MFEKVQKFVKIDLSSARTVLTNCRTLPGLLSALNGNTVRAWKAEPKGFFAFQGTDCQLTKQCSKLRRLSRKVVRLLTSQRENLHAVSQEQGKRGDGA